MEKEEEEDLPLRNRTEFALEKFIRLERHQFTGGGMLLAMMCIYMTIGAAVLVCDLTGRRGLAVHGKSGGTEGIGNSSWSSENEAYGSCRKRQINRRKAP